MLLRNCTYLGLQCKNGLINKNGFSPAQNIGDMVYYKRDSSHGWKGPAKVLGQDGAVLFLCHGPKYFKAHICCV